MMVVYKSNQKIFFISVLCFSVTALFISIAFGSVPLSLNDLLQALLFTPSAPYHETIVWDIRVPRALLSFFAGAGLATCGAAIQGVFRNPLADPGLIGVSSGAALGAILIIVLGHSVLPNSQGDWQYYLLPTSAFAGALLVLGLILKVSLWTGNFSIISILLVGIAVNAVIGAVIGGLTLISSNEALRDLTFWTMGSLGMTEWPLVLIVMSVVTFTCLNMFKHAPALNVYQLGDADAEHTGINVTQLRKQLFLYTALCIGAVVSVCGIIGFVGFLVPHLMRILTGANHKTLLPLSAIAGGTILTLCDVFARQLFTSTELPIGLLTSAIGGPIFLIVLVKFQHQRQS